MQTFADDTAEDLRDFVKARRGDWLKKEHYDSVMSGVTYIGVKAVSAGLAAFVWESTLKESLAEELKVEENQLIVKELKEEENQIIVKEL